MRKSRHPNIFTILLRIGFLVLFGTILFSCNKSQPNTISLKPAQEKSLFSDTSSALPISNHNKSALYLKGLFGDSLTFLEFDSTSQPLLGDFNGDGSQDSLFAIDILNSAMMPQGIGSTDPWSNSSNPSILNGASLLLLLGNISNKDLAIRSHLFQSVKKGIAEDAALPFAIHMRFTVLKKAELSKALDSLGITDFTDDHKGDFAVLGSYSSIDDYLYFDGKSYRIFSPESGP